MLHHSTAVRCNLGLSSRLARDGGVNPRSEAPTIAWEHSCLSGPDSHLGGREHGRGLVALQFLSLKKGTSTINFIP